MIVLTRACFCTESLRRHEVEWYRERVLEVFRLYSRGVVEAEGFFVHVIPKAHEKDGADTAYT